jgi:hypothetical protein
MPDDRRFSEEEIEHSLRELGAGIDYPPTPDVARSVRHRLEAEQSRRARRTPYWPPFLAPRWTAVAAAVVVVAVFALSPTLRATLSDFLVPGYQAGSRSAPGYESGGSEDRNKQEAVSEAAGAPEAGEDDAAPGCASPSLRAEPARAASGAAFRLRGRGFSSGCDGVTPARGIGVHFLQAGKTWRLATLDADRDLTFDARLRVPAGAGPGPATLRATPRSGEPVETRFVVLR